MTINYFGNGTFIGIIAPYESQKVQMGGDSRGIRYRVAIMGKHPFGDGELADTDLPFASAFSYAGIGVGRSKWTAVELEEELSPTATILERELGLPYTLTNLTKGKSLRS